MFKNMKLGVKIMLGFGLQIAIAMAMGGMAIINMDRASGNSTQLAHEYVPEVDVANDIRGAANRVMYEMRGFSFTENDIYYQKALKELEAMETGLAKGEKLAGEAVHLKQLTEQLNRIRSAHGLYKTAANETSETVKALSLDRSTLDENAAKYMTNSSEFMAGQNEKFKLDLTQRQRKVELITAVKALGSQARVTNFKAQATGDMALMRQAVESLAGLKVYVDELRTLIHDAEDVKLMDETEAAAAAYSGSMTSFVAAREKMTAADELMDREAAEYMQNCVDYLAGQNQKAARELDLPGANVKERLLKIARINELIETANKARVQNFKAQAKGDPKLMQEALDSLAGVEKSIADLRTITRDPADLERLDKIKTATTSYIAAIGQYREVHKSLGDIRQRMDQAAGQYVEKCELFIAGQLKKLSSDLQERLAKITLTNKIIVLGNETRVGAFKSQALRDPEIMKKAEENFPRIEGGFEELRKITRLDEDLRRIDQVAEAASGYRRAMGTFLTSWFKLQGLDKNRETAGKEMIDASRVTAGAGMEQTKNLALTAESSLRASSAGMYVGLIVALALGLILTVLITRSITGPLKKIIDGLSAGSDQVAAASTEVSSSSQSLAEGASEQAASLEETTSSMEEMSSMTRSNAENAGEADALMNEAASIISEASRSMEEMASSMTQIAQSGGEIGKIVKSIDEIAFQTNLLALNAAVEAARAGEAGAGFAVVADEVRALAMRAAEAAKNTQALVEDTVQRIEQGSSLADLTQDGFRRITESAEKVGGLVSEIAAASKEQAQGIEQVGKAMVQMDQVTQQVAANAEESASASEELNAQAVQMREIVEALQGIVGGVGNGHGKRAALKPAALPKRRIEHRGSPAPAITHKAVRPEQVIPFDGDEIEDF